MKTPMVYESYHIGRAPMLWGDQWMMKTIIDALGDYENMVGMNTSQYDGAVVTLPLHHNENYIDDLNADIRKLKWVLLILTANEFSSDAYKDIKHPNMKIWLQTPKKSDKADKFLPIGYPTDIKVRPRAKKLDWFFSGQVNHPARIACVEQLREMKGGKLIETAGFWQGLDHKDYIKLMAAAKVIPCPAGPETPDTFRFYEALELGCVPIVDNPWYYHKLFGKYLPFPTLKNWDDLPLVMKGAVENYEARSKEIVKWWAAYKKSIVTDLYKDIKELRSRV